VLILLMYWKVGIRMKVYAGLLFVCLIEEKIEVCEWDGGNLWAYGHRKVTAG